MEKKNGKAGRVILVILLLVLMIGLGVFFAYKSGLIGGKEEEKTVESTEPVENIEEKEEEDKELTVSEIVGLYKEKLEGQDRYALYDIDQDEIPELITHREDLTADKVDANYTIYSYYEGKIVELGKIAGKKDQNLLYKMNDNTLLSVYGYMGDEIDKVYKIEKGKLVEVSSEEKQVPSAQYTKGDEYIPFDFVTDTIQFEMYE